jgi:hypothetical protein
LAIIGRPPYFDTNGDGTVSSIDALLIINALNAPAGGEGEGSVGPVPADTNDSIDLLALDSSRPRGENRGFLKF